MALPSSTKANHTALFTAPIGTSHMAYYFTALFHSSAAEDLAINLSRAHHMCRRVVPLSATVTSYFLSPFFNPSLPLLPLFLSLQLPLKVFHSAWSFLLTISCLFRFLEASPLLRLLLPPSSRICIPLGWNMLR